VNQLEQLRQHTVVVADTGDIGAIARFKPQDATTNPSLIYKAAQDETYQALIDDAVAYGASNASGGAEQVETTMDRLFVNFGVEILKIIPGRVSTEVDARLSFDGKGTLQRARRIIELYEQAGVERERVLVKIASTWEGIRAADRLENEGIHCNLTLLFGFGQAVACAEAGVTLISPFVGRIYDWHKAARGVNDIPIDKDPGVESVTNIYRYFKKFEYPTQVMGASFRKVEQVTRLTGCDLLTISPDLLEELESSEAPIQRRLDPQTAAQSDQPKIEMDENGFRWMLNEDAMATEKLADGIRRFAGDAIKLEELVQKKVAQV